MRVVLNISCRCCLTLSILCNLLSLDLGMIISELLEQRGIVARGLAHPIAIGGFAGGESNTGAERPTVRKQKRRWEFNDEDSQLQGDLFSMFGAVKVSPRNFYRLLQTNQTMLLFPGKKIRGLQKIRTKVYLTDACFTTKQCTISRRGQRGFSQER